MPGPIISTGRAWLESLLIVAGLFFFLMFWDPATTYAFLSHVTWLQVIFGWVRELRQFLGW